MRVSEGDNSETQKCKRKLIRKHSESAISLPRLQRPLRLATLMTQKCYGFFVRRLDVNQTCINHGIGLLKPAYGTQTIYEQRDGTASHCKRLQLFIVLTDEEPKPC